MYVLIKLARSHPAIDFIIYGSEGPVSTRTLYSVQVSSSPYQSRPKDKKLSAVENVYDTVSNVSIYNYYHSMFGFRGTSVFLCVFISCKYSIQCIVNYCSKGKKIVYIVIPNLFTILFSYSI